MNTFNCMKIPEYIQTYEELFKNLQGEPVKILELGVLTGASLLMWADYFYHSKSEIIGLDMCPPRDLESLAGDMTPFLTLERVFQYQGMQDDGALLQEIIDKHGPFDIIIDDASHRGQPTYNSFSWLNKHVKRGGFYVIEDYGTGYWAPERGFDGQEYQGPNSQHYAGMVGVVKNLVDEVASMDLPGGYQRPSDWLSLEVRWGQAILRKK